MEAKKKKTTRARLRLDPVEKVEKKEEEVQSNEKPPVTHVVEVVSEPEEHQKSEGEPVSAPVVSSQVEEVQEKNEEEKEASLTPAIGTLEPQEEEKQKEVISELFQKEESSVYPEITMHEKGKSKTIIIWIAAVATVVLLLGGGLIVSMQKGSMGLPAIVATPTATPTPAPTPTPTPLLKREELTIQVLNGGGVAGAASKMKKFLEEKGYKVKETTNAKEYTYEKTEILVKTSKEAYIDLLKSDLEEEYTVGKAEATLPDDSSYDARVIVGKK